MDNANPAPATQRSDVHAWLTILGATTIFAFVNGSIFDALGLFAKPWMTAFKASAQDVMLVSTLCCMLTGFLGPIVGSLVSKYSYRLIMGVGSCLAAVTFLVTSAAPSIWVLIPAYTLLGAAAGAMTGPLVGQALAVRLFDKPGRAIGVVTVGQALGSSILSPIIGLLLNNMDWRDTMQLMAVAVAAMVPLIIFVLREAPLVSTPVAAANPSVPVTTTTQMSMLAIMRDPVFLGLMLAIFPLLALNSGLYYNLGLYVSELGGASSTAGTLMACCAIMAMVGIATSGWLSDRVDHRFLLAAALILVGTGVAILAAGASLATAFTVIPFISAGGSSLFALTPAALAARFGKQNFPRAIGVAQPVLVGSVSGAMLYGAVHDRLGSYHATFSVMLLLVVVAIAGFFLFARSLRPLPADEATLAP